VSLPPTTGDQGNDRYRTLEVLKDNIEAFTVALIMALVIKHFCVEAFKIPTGSMKPTLLGEKSGGVGDRILVDKWAYLTGGPDRWDVIVFRFPLNKAKHFIKRVAGVGGEWLRIDRGDIWTRADTKDAWRIATKPYRARNQLYVPVYPPSGRSEADEDRLRGVREFWEADDAWSVTAYDGLRFRGGAKARAIFLKRIGRYSRARDEYYPSHGVLVTDVRVRLRVTTEEAAALELRWSTGDDREAVLRIAPGDDTDGSHVRTRRPGRSVSEPLEEFLVPGRAMDVELECVDGQVYVRLDGQEVAHLDEMRGIDDLRGLADFTQSLAITAEGGPLEIESFRVDRDLFYADSGMEDLLRADHIESEDGGIWIPEDHYFALGDNTEESHDSRKWKLTRVPLRDGRKPILYYYDPRDPPRTGDDGSTIVIDADGIERSWLSEEEAEGAGRRTNRPFVHRDLIVGRAFYIFWPVFPDFPGRAGFIH
jgi:signal peptidase I